MRIETTVEIDVDDIIEEISDSDLIAEFNNRELLSDHRVALSMDEWELIEVICKGKNIIEADKIRSFFNQ